MNQLQAGPLSIGPSRPGAAAEGLVIDTILGILIIARTTIAVDNPVHPVAESVTQVDGLAGVIEPARPVPDDILNTFVNRRESFKGRGDNEVAPCSKGRSGLEGEPYSVGELPSRKINLLLAAIKSSIHCCRSEHWRVQFSSAGI